jgi:SAM-dependent methyltransferase
MSQAWARRFSDGRDDLTSVYSEIMVPRLFDPWAEVLLDTLAPAPGTTIVDVATGPGPVARAAARRVGAIGRVIGCDLSAAMLAQARRVRAAHSAAPIEYVECPADALALPDGCAAAVTCQHGLQFFPDRVAALAEMRRVARPGGRLAVAVWRTIEDSALFAGLADGVDAAFGAQTAAGYRGGPFALAGADELVTLADAAGWQAPRVVRKDLPIAFDSPEQLMRTLAVTPLASRLRELDEAGIDALVAAVTTALGPLVDRDGAVRSTTGAHILLATR